MNWLGIKEWVWILIFCYIGTALLIPILYFIKWELWNRKDWIRYKIANESDNRFFDYDENKINKIQIAEVRPQIKDVWSEFISDYSYWWVPIASYFIFLYLFSYLLCRPFNSFWTIFVKWFGNLKV